MKKIIFFTMLLIGISTWTANAATLSDLQLVTHAYYKHIVADAHTGRFLSPGAGQRLDEKPRKNWHSRISNMMYYCAEHNMAAATTQLHNAINAWRDHVGLLVTYLQTHQMSLEHVLHYLGDYVTQEELQGPHDEVRAYILAKMAALPPQAILEDNAFSIGAEQYRRLLHGVCSE